jgi:hypothetical protein
MANGRCESEPMPRDNAAGSSPRRATSMVIMIGRKGCTEPSMAALPIWPKCARGVIWRARSWKAGWGCTEGR